MQALSHSYHTTGGAYALCDLQGGTYRDGVVLTDPVVMSHDNRYGATDLGPNGITAFFSRHVCNAFCRPEWMRPKLRQVPAIPARKGTSMMNSRGEMLVPSRKSPVPMSRQYAIPGALLRCGLSSLLG
jgi:Alpha-kinase family